MAWAEGVASGWVGGWALVPLGGCLLLCGLCRRKLAVCPTLGAQPRDTPSELRSLYISDPTAGTSVAASPRPPAGPCSTDNEDEDDFHYPPAPWTEAQHSPVFESLKQARESGNDVDSHGSYVNINSEEDYVNLQGATGGSSEEKDKEYLELIPLEAEQTGPHTGKSPSRDQGENVPYANVDLQDPKTTALEEQKADYDYVNMP